MVNRGDCRVPGDYGWGQCQWGGKPQILNFSNILAFAPKWSLTPQTFNTFTLSYGIQIEWPQLDNWNKFSQIVWYTTSVVQALSSSIGP